MLKRRESEKAVTSEKQHVSDECNRDKPTSPSIDPDALTFILGQESVLGNSQEHFHKDFFKRKC